MKTILTVNELKALEKEDKENALSILLLAGPDNFEGDFVYWMYRLEK